jgi:hypothetical protein
MAENNENNNGLMPRMGMLSLALSEMYPNGKSVVIFSLNDNEFEANKKFFKVVEDGDQFKIDISGIEFIYIKDSSINSTH